MTVSSHEAASEAGTAFLEFGSVVAYLNAIGEKPWFSF